MLYILEEKENDRGYAYSIKVLLALECGDCKNQHQMLLIDLPLLKNFRGTLLSVHCSPCQILYPERQ